MNANNPLVKGDPLVIKFTPGTKSQPGHFYVNGKKFSDDIVGGNDCLIHAVMKSSGSGECSPSKVREVRKHIASCCLDKMELA